MSSELFYKIMKVLKHSLMFLDFLRVSEALSVVLSGSESFLKTLSRSLTLLGCHEVFSSTTSRSEMLLKVLRRSLMF